MVSSDGVTWTSYPASVADETTAGWRAVTFGNDKFVAVSPAPAPAKAMYSTDGVNWTSSTTVPSGYWTNITYGNGTFVAMGAPGKAIYSTMMRLRGRKYLFR